MNWEMLTAGHGRSFSVSLSQLSRVREGCSDKFGHRNCVILRDLQSVDFEPMRLTR